MTIIQTENFVNDRKFCELCSFILIKNISNTSILVKIFWQSFLFLKIVCKIYMQKSVRKFSDIGLCCLKEHKLHPMISGLLAAYIRRISGISQAYLRHISGIPQAQHRNLSGISKAYLSHISGISQSYKSSIPLVYQRHISGIYKSSLTTKQHSIYSYLTFYHFYTH